MKRLVSNPVLQVGVVLLVLTLLTMVVPLSLDRVTQIAIYALYAAGIGYLGLVPFGGSVFFGLASYAAAIGILRLFPQSGEWLGILFAVAFTVVVAVPVGLLILRRTGLYFSLLTLACAQICYEMAYKWTDFTGGENGLQNVPRPMMESALAYHVFVVLVVIVLFALLWRLMHSPLGRLF